MNTIARPPCDQDYLRKLAGDTDAQLLQSWFNREVVGIFKQHHAFDAEGIFIGDASYLFVSDNEHYEGSSRLLFDEQNHPVDSAKLTREQQKAYDWRRCYKLVTLLHTNRAGEFFLYGGLRLTAGKDHVNSGSWLFGRGEDRPFLPCKSFAPATREIRAAILPPTSEFSSSLMKPFPRPAGPTRSPCSPLCLNRNRFFQILVDKQARL